MQDSAPPQAGGHKGQQQGPQTGGLASSRRNDDADAVFHVATAQLFRRLFDALAGKVFSALTKACLEFGCFFLSVQDVQTMLAGESTRLAVEHGPTAIVVVAEGGGTGHVRSTDGSCRQTGDYGIGSRGIEDAITTNLDPLLVAFAEVRGITVTLDQGFSFFCGQEGDEGTLTCWWTDGRVADDKRRTVDHIVLESHSTASAVRTLAACHLALGRFCRHRC